MKPIILLEIWLNILVILWNLFHKYEITLFSSQDEESIFNGGQPDASWERFAVVAADLLERIQSSITYSISPCASSDDEDVSTGRIGNLWQGHFNKWLEDEN